VKKTIRPLLCALLVMALIIGANLIMPAAGSERIPNLADSVLPTITDESGFQDVPPDAWYAEAVRWGLENGVTKGTSATTFSPDEPCTRAQMITFLWRMSTGQTETAETPEPTPEPMTFADRPREPYAPEPTIYPEYQLDYYGRLTFYDSFDRYDGHAFFSIGLYDTLDSAMIDLDDTAFIMKREGGCYAIGDHNYPSFWVIRYAGPGDVLSIRKKNGAYERYAYMYTDRHVRNAGSDFLFDNGESAFFTDADLFLVTCNDDGAGKYVTATFWRRVA